MMLRHRHDPRPWRNLRPIELLPEPSADQFCWRAGEVVFGPPRQLPDAWTALPIALEAPAGDGATEAANG